MLCLSSAHYYRYNQHITIDISTLLYTLLYISAHYYRYYGMSEKKYWLPSTSQVHFCAWPSASASPCHGHLTKEDGKGSGEPGREMKEFTDIHQLTAGMCVCVCLVRWWWWWYPIPYTQIQIWTYTECKSLNFKHTRTDKRYQCI